MCQKINKNDEKEMKQIEDIWLKRSIEVHDFVNSNPTQFWKSQLPKFRQDIENGDGYVYEKDREVKGFITFRRCKGHIYIYELFTHKSGEGIGLKLLNEVKIIGKPNPLTLHVYAHNVLAIKWYLGQGFIIIQPHESNTLQKEINTLKKEIGKLREFGQDDTVKKEELKYKKQQLKYLMICPNYFSNKT